jgi:hypothetical protein
MSLNPSGPKPVVTIRIGGIQTTGSGDFYFQGQVVGSFNTNKALHTFNIDPLINSEIGWVVTFTSFPQSPIQFSFAIDVQQSGTSIITPINIDQNSPKVVKSTHSALFDGILKL